MSGFSRVKRVIVVVVAVVTVPLALFSQNSRKKIDPPLVRTYVMQNNLEGHQVLNLYKKDYSQFKEDEVNIWFKQDYTSIINTMKNILSSDEGFGYKKVNQENFNDFMADALTVFWSNFSAVGSNKNLMESLDDREADCDISALLMSDIIHQFNPRIKIEYQFVRRDFKTSGHVMLKINDKYYDTTTGDYGLKSLTILDQEQLEDNYNIIYNPLKSYLTLVLNQQNKYEKANDLQTESYTLHNQANNLIGNVIYMDDKYLLEQRITGGEIPFENFELALENMNKAIELNDNNPDLYLTRAIIKNEIGYDIYEIIYDMDQASMNNTNLMLLMRYKAQIYEDNDYLEDSKRVRNQIKSIEDKNDLMSFNNVFINTNLMPPQNENKLEILKKQARKAQKPSNQYTTKQKRRKV